MAIYRGSGSSLSATQLAGIDGNKGDITVSNSGALWLINNGVITASEVSNIPSGNLLSTDVQNALNELQTELDTKQVSDINIAKLNVTQSWTQQQTFKELKDTVFTITDGAGFEIDPGNGSIQTITLGANRTPSATNFEAGQIVLLGIDDGTAFTITWTTVGVTWVRAGGTASAPTLATTGFTWVLLWKVGTIVYGLEVGKP